MLPKIRALKPLTPNQIADQNAANASAAQRIAHDDAVALKRELAALHEAFAASMTQPLRIYVDGKKVERLIGQRARKRSLLTRLRRTFTQVFAHG